MTRTFIAALTAAALALGSVVPASAQQQQDNETLAKLLAGAAGLYVLGKVVSDRNDRRERRSTSNNVILDRTTSLQDLLAERERNRSDLDSVLGVDDDRIARHDDDRRRRDRDFDRRDRRWGERSDNCWTRKWRGGKWVKHRDGRCMKHWKKNKHRRVELPRECLRKRWTQDGWVTYHSRRCLARYGIDDRRYDRRSGRYRD